MAEVKRVDSAPEFNHLADNLPDALGLAEQGIDVVCEYIVQTIINAGTPSQVIQELEEKAQTPRVMRALLYVLFNSVLDMGMHLTTKQKRTFAKIAQEQHKFNALFEKYLGPKQDLGNPAIFNTTGKPVMAAQPVNALQITDKVTLGEILVEDEASSTEKLNIQIEKEHNKDIIKKMDEVMEF